MMREWNEEKWRSSLGYRTPAGFDAAGSSAAAYAGRQSQLPEVDFEEIRIKIRGGTEGGPPAEKDPRSGKR